VNSLPKSDVKSQAREVLESLPDDSSWDELMYRLYVRQKIESGLKDVEESRTISDDEVRKLFDSKK
jgi:hypothetical protein